MQDAPPITFFFQKGWAGFTTVVSRAAQNTAFRRMYAVCAVAVLLASVLFWAVLGARLQQHNADQLSDPYLFKNWATFKAASFPGAHTFLIKWPIFWLIGIFGISPKSLLVATVAVVLLTVATLAYVLYRIDRRPLVFGTVCLGLALVLLLVPAQPYAGGLLPVNMAMLTTRNLEYAVYLVALVLFARAKRLRDLNFIIATIALALLVASDKLFLSLSAGGAVLGLLAYALLGNWSITAFMARWLAGSIVAAAGAMAILFGISALHITHLVNSAAASPYGVVHSAQSLVLGAVYAIAGLFTNLGANPAYDKTVLRQLPNGLVTGLWGYSGLAYVFAACLLIFALVAVWRVLRPTFSSAPRGVVLPAASLLSLSLIASSLAAFGVFVATTHYYAVDARYLTICFFALAVVASVRLRRQQWRWPEDLILVSCALLPAIALAAVTASHISQQQTAALHGITERNDSIVAALKHHKVDVLVGDYWRVLPVKLASHDSLNVMPMADCTQPASVLTSNLWQPNLAKHSFAYLLSLDRSLTNYPTCTLAQITAKYGGPNASQVIAGTPASPTETLLFYDQGSRMPAQPPRQTVQSVLPIDLKALPGTGCDQPTIMNVVAHEDDDLLFMSPDLLHDIDAGRCVRTVFLTAGDSGYGKFYWLSRQLGSEAAYGNILNRAAWDQQTVKLAADEYATIATPSHDHRVSLIFLNLPDGNLHGEGFANYAHQSLERLYSGSIGSLESVDGQSHYTSQQLVSALADLMNVYQPAAIHTQADVPSANYPDHSDHIATGQYAQAAAAEYDQKHFGGGVAIPVARYIGYPVHGYDVNVSADDLARKEAAFLAYGQYDGGVCHSIAQCESGTTYSFYLPRQYQEP